MIKLTPIFGSYFKGRPDLSYFIFEINVGKKRIGHKTTPNFIIQSILNRSKNSLFNFRVVLCRIRLFPISITKKWLVFELPLKYPVLWIN